MFLSRTLYIQVHINEPNEAKIEEKPIIVIEAGQEAGTESVSLALYLIEQLVSCLENQEMIQKMHWLILPSTNPDGQEFSRVVSSITCVILLIKLNIFELSLVLKYLWKMIVTLG